MLGLDMIGLDMLGLDMLGLDMLGLDTYKIYNLLWWGLSLYYSLTIKLKCYASKIY